MSVTVMLSVLRRSVLRLTAPQKAVLVVLASYADDEGGNCFPSVQTIGRDASLCERAVRTALSHLRKLGAIEVVERRAPHRSTRYRLRVDIITGESGIPARDAAHKAARDAAHDTQDRHEVPAAEMMTGTTCRDDRHLVPKKPARDAADPSLTDHPKEEIRDTARAHSVRRQHVPDERAERVRALMARGSETGIPLQRFLLEREFLPQIATHDGEAFAVNYVAQFVEWARPIAIQELAGGPLSCDPVRWWRDVWAWYGREIRQAANA